MSSALLTSSKSLGKGLPRALQMCRVRFNSTEAGTERFNELNESLNGYYDYHRLAPNMRPFIYRAKHAKELKYAEIKDARGNVLSAREAPKIPSLDTFNELIANCQTTEQFRVVNGYIIDNFKLADFQYLRNDHLNTYLIEASKQERLSHALRFIYSVRPLGGFLDVSNIHVLALLQNLALIKGSSLSIWNYSRRFQSIEKFLTDKSLVNDSVYKLSKLASVISVYGQANYTVADGKPALFEEEIKKIADSIEKIVVPGFPEEGHIKRVKFYEQTKYTYAGLQLSLRQLKKYVEAGKAGDHIKKLVVEVDEIMNNYIKILENIQQPLVLDQLEESLKFNSSNNDPPNHLLKQEEA